MISVKTMIELILYDMENRHKEDAIVDAIK